MLPASASGTLREVAQHYDVGLLGDVGAQCGIVTGVKTPPAEVVVKTWRLNQSGGSCFAVEPGETTAHIHIKDVTTLRVNGHFLVYNSLGERVGAGYICGGSASIALPRDASVLEVNVAGPLFWAWQWTLICGGQHLGDGEGAPGVSGTIVVGFL